MVAGIAVTSSMVKKSQIASAQSLSRGAPINAIPDASLWLESSLDSSFSSGENSDNTALSTWNDQRNSANKVTIVKVGTGPVYSNTINRVHAVKFDGSDSNYLKIADASFLNNTDYTIFILEKRQSNKSNNYFFGDSSSGAPSNQNLILGYSSDGEVIHAQGANTYSSFVSNYANSNDNPRLFAFVQSSVTGKKTYINGVLAAQSSNTAQLTNITELAIGKGYQGEIGEIAIFARALEDDERASIEDYAGTKWTNKINRNLDSSCIGSTVTSSGCNSSTCTFSLAGTSTTQVADGSGSISCNSTHYTGSVSYSCSSGTFTPSGSCACATGYTGTGCNSCDSGYTASGGSCVLAALSPCTGGTIDTTTVSGATIHKFTSSGTLTCPTARNIEILVVAGGGGGINIGGGGGGGGVVYKSSHAITTSAYSVTVGNGGAIGANGQNSVFDTITAYGGGGGGPNHSAGLSGGSGGGAGRDGTALGGSATRGVGGTASGNAGGNGATTIWSGGGGGGGAGGVGGNSLGGTSTTERGGAGGIGISNSISGVATYYAGGGGGGNEGNANVALGGTGGGGNGGASAGGTVPVAGTPNTGGGGGGTKNSGTGAVGGSGIVIIRY